MTLKEFFADCPEAALGLSGGVDSAYLLYAALQNGAAVKPYFIRTPFQPESELRDARRIAEKMKVELTVLEYDVLADPVIASNPPERCYYCKRAIFGLLRERAAADGYRLILDGTNASDVRADRPGMKALEELGIRSPLAGMRTDERQNPDAFQGSRNFYLGQAFLRLSRHPVSGRNFTDRRKSLPGGRGGKRADRDGLFRFSRARLA